MIYLFHKDKEWFYSFDKCNFETIEDSFLLTKHQVKEKMREQFPEEEFEIVIPYHGMGCARRNAHLNGSRPKKAARRQEKYGSKDSW